VKPQYSRRDERLLDNDLGGLRAGSIFAQVHAELHSIALRGRQKYPDVNKDCEADVDGAAQRNSRVMSSSAESCCACQPCLVHACANTANLMLARAARQLQQTGIRTALGASRLRIFGQFLTESVLPSLGGTTIGLLVTARLSPWAHSGGPGHDPVG